MNLTLRVKNDSTPDNKYNQTNHMKAFQVLGDLTKEAARGDQLTRLLARLGGTNIDSLFFKSKTIKPGGVVRGVEGWQSSPVIGKGPGGMSHWFSGRPTEHAFSEVRGGDLIKKLKETLPQSINERGGGWYGNEQQDAAGLLRQIRNATRTEKSIPKKSIPKGYADSFDGAQPSN